MTTNEDTQKFSETHHALLFACIARAVVEQAGEEKGEAVIRKAVRRYGEERGQRMAQRARANGHALSMTNYLAYSEFRALSTETRQQIREKIPHARAVVTGCSWCSTWRESGLLPYGRLYCLEIDEAVVRGFNPQLKIDVVETESNGAAQCEFVFRDANLTPLNILSIAVKKSIRPGKKAVMPWEYHAGHLFATLEQVILVELGEEGQAAVSAGLDAFAALRGEEARQVVLTRRGVDYSRAPGT